MDSLLRRAFDPEFFRAQGHDLIDRLADYLRAQQSGNAPGTIPWRDPSQELEFWKNWQGNPDDLSGLFEAVLDHSIHLHNPRYMGHQISVPAPASALAGLVSNLLNNGTGVYEMGMASNAMELIAVKAVTDPFGWGESAGGHLTSGGTLANLTGLLAARRAKSPRDVWVEGDGEPLGLLVSEEAHYSVDRAVRVMGWGSEGIGKVPSDEQYRMRTDLLESIYQEKTRNGVKVIAVVASGCATATGAYDDLEAIAAFCRKHDLWMHVDGAHGGAAIFAPSYRHLLKGIEKADSVIMDFHKMLLVPALATGVFFRDRSHSYNMFSLQADYLLQKPGDEVWYDSLKRTFECTKLMMGLKIFALLQAYGTALWEENVTRCFDLGKVFARIIRGRPGWELAYEPQCNIVCFRFLGRGGDPDEFNARIRRQLVEEGEFYIVQTRLRGKVWLRTSLQNPFTGETDLEGLLEKLEELAFGE